LPKGERKGRQAGDLRRAYIKRDRKCGKTFKKSITVKTKKKGGAEMPEISHKRKTLPDDWLTAPEEASAGVTPRKPGAGDKYKSPV
jgi:hypothetical protein